MKKRILPILLALIMVLTLLPTLALADGGKLVATIGDNDYYDLATAIGAAQDGETVEIAAGTYELRGDGRDAFSIWRAVNLKGSTGGETIIRGTIEYAVTGDGKGSSITVENITFEPLGNKNNQALCWSNDQISGSPNKLTGYNLVVKNCKFDGWKFAVGVNSCADSCSLRIENTAFENVLCAAAVEEGKSNRLAAFDATDDSTFEYAVQVWGSISSTNYNCYYNEYEEFLADESRTGGADNVTGVWPAAARIGNTYYSTVGEAVNAADDDDTVNILAGEYDIGSLRISKAVNLVGAGDSMTTLNGSVDYTTAANGAEITISGLFFEADGTNTNHALNFSALKDSTINVTDCDFKGYQFGIGVNSQATGNTLKVSDSVFYEVNCAAGIKVGEANNDVTFTNVDTNGGFAVQAFNGIYSGEDQINGYYETIESYESDKGDGFKNPDYNAAADPATLVTPATFEAALASAKAGDTLMLAPGTYKTAANKWFTTPVNIIGSGVDNTIIEGALWLGGGNSVPVNNVTTLTVKEVTFKNTEGVNNWSTVGLGFVQIYGCDITVENCVFDGWQYGVHMNGTNTGTVLNFVNVDFKNTFVGISAQLDGAKIGEIAENVLTTENAFAVQAFTATEDYNYYTLADFNTARAGSTETGINDLDNSELAEGIAYENGGGMLRGYVLTNGDDVQAAIDKLPDSGKSYIVLTPGEYNGFTVDKSLTILGANAGKNPNDEDVGHGLESVINGKVTIYGYTNGTKPTVVFDGVAFAGEGRIWSQNGNGFCGVNLTVQNCKAVNISDHFVYTTNPGTGDYRNGTIKIINNYVSGVHNATGTASAFNLWYAEEHIIMGNVVESVDYNAFNLNDTVGDVTFIENKISNVGQNGFQIANSAAEGALVEIGNNVFTNVDGNAIYFLGHSTDPAQIKSDIEILNTRMNGCDGAIVFERVSNVNAEAEDNFADGEPVSIVFIDSEDVNVANVNVLVDGVVVYASSGKVPYSIQLPAAPTKPGYIFMGWKCSDGHTHQANETVTVEKDMTFTAVWSNLPDIEPGEPDEPDEPDVPDFPFTDVSVNAWYYEAVKYVYENGIMNGMDRYSFQPNGTLTRAMVWTMLARLDGVDTEGGNSWYAKAQEWATANSVSDGENPTGEVTREQLVTMLYRYAQYKGYDVSIGEDTNILSYVDVDQVSDWAMEAFQWACGTGVIEGDENSALTPKASTTRAQAAAMFMRFIEL